MSLRHALLALLSAQPMTGYDVTKLFDGSVGQMWQAPHSQIYPELRRMEADGLVDGEVVPRGTRAQKRRYALTKAGAQELDDWLAAPADYPPVRDVARLHTAYLERVGADAARAHFRAHQAHHERLLHMWTAMRESIASETNAVLAERLRHGPEDRRRATVAWKVFAYDALVGRARLEIAWAKKGLDLVDELHAAS